MRNLVNGSAFDLRDSPKSFISTVERLVNEMDEGLNSVTDSRTRGVDGEFLTPVPKPFHQWKSEEYAKDQAAGTPRTRERYYRDYGAYCTKVRRETGRKDKS